MNELLAGYANYASTDAVVTEAHLGQWREAMPDTGCSVSVFSNSFSFSCFTV